jgi:GT2 family glycosyltransferase
MAHDPVTVCVTNYNGADYLPWCLDAVKSLHPEPDEILVVDNASIDGSVDLLKTRYPEVRLFCLPQNEGPCPARNLGLREAAHPLVFQIDCDIAPHPDCLERLMNAMKEGSQGVAACQPRAVFDDDPHRIHYEGAFYHYVGALSLIHFYAPVPSGPEGPREVDAFISMAVLLDRDAVLEAGGYDSRFFILFEDHDLSYRLRLQGRKLLAVPGAVVAHREGTAGVSFRTPSPYPRTRAFLQSRNRWIVLLKNHRFRTLLLSLPGLLLFETAWLGFSLREGFLLEYIKGKLSALRMLPTLLRARRKIQASRQLKDRALLGSPELTFSPLIQRSGFEAFLVDGMNRLLKMWWCLVKALVG